MNMCWLIGGRVPTSLIRGSIVVCTGPVILAHPWQSSLNHSALAQPIRQFGQSNPSKVTHSTLPPCLCSLFILPPFASRLHESFSSFRRRSLASPSPHPPYILRFYSLFFWRTRPRPTPWVAPFEAIFIPCPRASLTILLHNTLITQYSCLPIFFQPDLSSCPPSSRP